MEHSLSTYNITDNMTTTNRIPLQIPFCEDPRTFSISRLRNELTTRKLHIVDKQNKKDMMTQLVHAYAQDRITINPLMMADEQPEKWMLIANQCSAQAEQIEPNGETRVRIMQQINEVVLEPLKTSRPELIAIATGQCSIANKIQCSDNAELCDTIARFASALMLHIAIRYEYPITQQKQINGSIAIFNMRTGFLGVPRTLKSYTIS